MLVLQDKPLNSPVIFLIEGAASAAASLRLYIGGTIATTAITSEALAPAGPLKLTFTPTATGLHTVVAADGSIAAYIDVVAKTSTAFLSNIEDEALGSWSWDKTEGTLELLRQDGSGLATFAVIDTMTTSSRERIQ